MGFLRAVTDPSIGDRLAEAGGTVPRRKVIAAALLSLLAGIGILAGSAGTGSAPVATAHHRLAPHAGVSSIPSAAQGVVSAALGADSARYRVTPSAGGLQARSAAQHMRLGFAPAGVRIRSGRAQVSLSVAAFGYGRTLQAVGAVRPTATANRVTYSHRGWSEWYRNGPLGLEQGFTISRAPSSAAAGPLTLAMTLSRDARASVDPGGQGATLDHVGATLLRYSALAVTDASGRALHPWLELRGGRLLLRVDARDARYPLQIDPLIQQGSKLTGGEELGTAEFGVTVALSADGNTALVGGPGDNGGAGAVWAFTRSGSSWSQQGPKLTGGEEVGTGQFGYTSALSADGNTALIGGGRDNTSVGAAWVFTRSGSTWTQQGPKLTGAGEVGEGHFGCCGVALSGDGNTALIGGYGDNGLVGAAWVFTRSGSTWTQQGAKLTGGGEAGKAHFGFAVSLSGEGSTALIGGGADNTGVGAAWVFTRSGSSWTQQGAKLTGGEEAGAGQLGYTAALSADGNTALIGGGSDNARAGAAWVFTRSGPTWSQQGPKLTGGEEVGEGHFGCCGVALSGDGNTALIGGYGDNGSAGAAWTFTRLGTAWTQLGGKLTGGGEVGEGGFGSSVALSAHARSALIGGYTDHAGAGAAWSFETTSHPPAVVTGAPSTVAQTSATLNATVNPEGEAVSDCHFEYGATEAYGSSAPCGSLPGSGTSPVAVSAALTGLTASTTYHLRVVATNALGTSYGADATLTTTPSQPPVVATEAASAVASTSATLNATVDPEDEAVSDCHFEYGATEAYGSSVPCASLPGATTSPVAVSAALTGLGGSTTYHFRVVATNPTGTSYGADATLTTTPSQPPAVVTQAASAVAPTSATLNATVNPEDEAVGDCHFEYGPTETYGSSAPCASLPGSGTSPVAVSAALTGLGGSTTYHFRVVATNPTGTSYGADATLTTTPTQPPSVVTSAATAVAPTSATLNATVNPEDEAVGDCHFEYGPTETYGSSAPCYPAPGSGTSPVAVSAALTGLTPSTTYHFRIVATNPTGTSQGADRTFATPLRPPTVVTGAASALAQTTATLNATVNPNESNVSDCRFEYGPSGSYGSSAPCNPAPGSGASPVAVSAALTGLTPNTTYHFRIVATNGGGASAGSDQTLMTATPVLPEVGRCLLLAKASGKYGSSTCTTKSAGENTGKYEWQPWPAAKNHFAFKNGAATFETVHKYLVKCLENTLTGTYSGSQRAAMTLTFGGCEAAGASGGKCQSDGAAPGEIVTAPLEGQLGVIKAATTPSVGWDLKPASGLSLAVFTCGATQLSVTGSVIAPVTSVDKMLVTFAFKFKAAKGKQVPERFEAALNDTLSFVTTSSTEQAGLTMSDSIVGEEALEIKAIV
jgi:phosphodiesterase/alkaline phosphatase D-like protein